MATNVWLEGADVLERRIREMARDLAGASLVEAAQAGADLVAERARALAPVAPVDGGTLRDSIGTSVSQAEHNIASVAVGYDEKAAFYGRFQELGTVHHAAQPFLRPANRREKARTVGAVAQVLRRKLGL